jgi:hypothetical protein
MSTGAPSMQRGKLAQGTKLMGQTEAYALPWLFTCFKPYTFVLQMVNHGLAVEFSTKVFQFGDFGRLGEKYRDSP